MRFRNSIVCSSAGVRQRSTTVNEAMVSA